MVVITPYACLSACFFLCQILHSDGALISNCEYSLTIYVVESERQLIFRSAPDDNHELLTVADIGTTATSRYSNATRALRGARQARDRTRRSKARSLCGHVQSLQKVGLYNIMSCIYACVYVEAVAPLHYLFRCQTKKKFRCLLFPSNLFSVAAHLLGFPRLCSGHGRKQQQDAQWKQSMAADGSSNGHVFEYNPNTHENESVVFSAPPGSHPPAQYDKVTIISRGTIQPNTSIDALS